MGAGGTRERRRVVVSVQQVNLNARTVGNVKPEMEENDVQQGGSYRRVMLVSIYMYIYVRDKYV